MSSLWQAIKDEVRLQLADFRAFIALAGTTTAGRTTIQRITEATAGSEQHARIEGFAVDEGDEIVCLIVGGKPLILGKLQRTAPTEYTLRTPLEIAANDDAALVITDGLGTGLGNARVAVDVVNFSGKGAFSAANGMRYRAYSDGFLTLTFEVDGANGDTLIGGALNHDGANVGLYGVTPATRPPAYTVTNLTTDRTYDANASSTAELADVVGTLISDLRSLGIVQ